jgi:C_GCAxxG_C_C family probable redox protein
MIMKKHEIALYQFNNGCNCAQSVVYAFADDFGLNKETALTIATGFGAGLGRKQHVCGAVSGAIMILSLKYGKIGNTAKEQIETTYKKVQEYLQAFKKEKHSINCIDLLNGCQLMTEEGQELYKKNHLRTTCCNECVKLSCNILEEILK